jgi:hypothetical protein
MDMLGSSSQTIKLETGAEAKGAGININADVTANATLSGKLSLGFETSGVTPVAFIVPGRTLTLDVGASATITSAPLNLGILSLSISSGSISFDSHVDVALTDTADSDERMRWEDHFRISSALPRASRRRLVPASPWGSIPALRFPEWT